MRLTAQAEILVAHTEAVLERLERAEADIATSLTELPGTVRIASFQTAALTLVPTALGLLREAHPGLRVHFRHTEPERALPAPQARDPTVAPRQLPCGRCTRRIFTVVRRGRSEHPAVLACRDALRRAVALRSAQA